MSELAKTTVLSAKVKSRLLAGASLLWIPALWSASAFAGETTPAVWIELGGQLERLSDSQESYSPPFVSALLNNPFTAPAEVEAPPRYTLDEEAKVSVQPSNSNWIFSVGVRYGRANSSGNTHQETPAPSPIATVSVPALDYHVTSAFPAAAKRFATTRAGTHATHLVLDFLVGRDVGLGVFGNDSSSRLNFGVRFAQFNSRSAARIDSDPDFTIEYKYQTTFAGFPASVKLPVLQHWNVFTGTMSSTQSFSGLGPSLAWDTNAAILGSRESGSVTLDFGLNGALLFGRQKMSAAFQTMAHHGSLIAHTTPLPTLYPTKSHNTARSRSVVVPNVGSFAAVSLRFTNAKLTLGYRADFFLNAIDGGLDTRRTYDRNFYGPFATISIGLGG